MKKLLSILVVFMATISVYAQSQDSTAVAFRYGVVSYDKILAEMPDYQRIDADMAALKANFDTEMTVAENEFNTKYETFLAEQKTYAPAILRKRQSELEDMMKRNEQFRLESLRLLDQARADMVKAVRAKVDATIAGIAQLYQLAFVLNTDSEAVPYLNASMAYNLTDVVIEAVSNQVETTE